MNKGELMRKLNMRNADPSLPQNFIEDMKKLYDSWGIQFDPYFWVMDYENSTFGKPVNMAEKYLEIFDENIDLL